MAIEQTPAKKIILLSDHPDDATFLSEVSSKCSAKLIIVPSVEDCVNLVLLEKPSALFIDVSKIERLREFEATVQRRVGLFSDLVRPQQIYMLSETELSANREVVLSPFFGNFYQRPLQDSGANGEFFGRYVLAGSRSTSPQLKEFLMPQSDVQMIELNHTHQKQEAAEAVRQYLLSAKLPARIANMIANAVDELIMNAMFDAPCDDFGKSIYSSTSRTQERNLNGKEKVQLTLAFDGFHVGVNVTDHFGSIDRQRLLNHVSANYKDRDYTVKQGQAGAGLGMASVYNSGASLIYHCDVRSKTETTLLYRAFASYREFKSQFKFFSAKFYV